MASCFDYANTTALVTGASSGIGESFAEILAKRGSNLVLVARNARKLESLAARLCGAYRIKATVIAADLADASAPDTIHASAKAQGLAINLLINNAGFALAGAFLEHDLNREEEQIAVNVTALTSLSHLFGAEMSAFGGNAGIINIASSAAFQPVPFSAVYAASKAFVLLFSEALGRELRPQGIRVLAVCPGLVETEFFNKIRANLPANKMDASDHIAAQALAAFDKRKAVVIPGRFANRLRAIATRFIPRAVLVKMAEQASRKILMR